MKRTRAEHVARVVQMLVSGIEPQAIADELGGTVSAVYALRRRRQITAQPTRAPEPKPAPVPRKTTERPCLCCRKPFDSDGLGNRLCRVCKGSEVFAGSQPTVHAVVGF